MGGRQRRKEMVVSSAGIVTIVGDTNFGNRLQNFALQEALLSMGVDRVETIEGLPTGEAKSVKLARVASTALERRAEYANRLLRRGDRPTRDVYTCPPERRRAIRDFTARHIHTSSERYERGQGQPAVRTVRSHHRWLRPGVEPGVHPREPGMVP